MDAPRAERNRIIERYFRDGYSYNEIRECLAHQHDIVVSQRHLKRLLNRKGLYRRKHHTPLDEVINYIHSVIRTSGQLHGYRWVHLKCVRNGLNVDRETVRIILQILDPDGVECRRRRRLRRRRYSVPGPNFIWHVDGYDKLKPYGICINGCIDGYSRKVIWLNAWHNNSDPKLIAGYFLESVRACRGCPTVVRTDLGTENAYMKRMQPFLRGGVDALAGERSFIQGPSKHNQRIEGWWSFLRKHCTQYWMNVFSELRDDSLYTGTFLDKALIQFCFLNLIQEELNNLQLEWNRHRITPSRNQVGPFGRPNILFNVPELYRARDHLEEVDMDGVEVCEDECVFRDEYPCDPDVFELSCIEMADNNLDAPTNTVEAAVLYEQLRGLLLLHI